MKTETKLAIDGGNPVRQQMLPYGRQWLNQTDIQSVVDVLQSDWLTTGPKVTEFEQAFAQKVTAKEAVAISNGTAALHAAMFAADIQPGDEVIVPTMTFAASANAVVYQGAKPVFVDVDPNTGLIDVARVSAAITPQTKVIVAVDYAGQSCAYDELRDLAEQHHCTLVADACHALGGSYKEESVGAIADLNTFSFHPVKHIASGEGGMVTTNDAQLAQRMRVFRNHGITTDHRQREVQGSWFYEMVDLGFNYRLSDIQCALGIAQLNRLDEFVQRRRLIAKRYDNAFASLSEVKPLLLQPEAKHAYHLYVVRFALDHLKADRGQLFSALRAEGIGVNVHYIPVHLHPFYQNQFGTTPGMCPAAEALYESIVSLPMFPGMTDEDQNDVIEAMNKMVEHYRLA